MNRQANAAFLRNDFARRPWFRKVNCICRCRSGDSSGWLWWGGGAGQKIGNDIFHPWQIQHLHVEFRDESQWRCCCGKMGAATGDNAITSGLGLSTIEKHDLHRNGENV
jgi:hypothetical protein